MKKSSVQCNTAHSYFSGHSRDFSSNLADETIFYTVTEKKNTYIICIFLIDILRRNEYVFFCTNFSDVNISKTSRSKQGLFRVADLWKQEKKPLQNYDFSKCVI